MKEFKGTKGEWKFLYTTQHPINEEETVSFVQLQDVAIDICQLKHISKERAEANAKLIAAAPELLELCLLVYGSFGGGNVITFSDKDIEDYKKAISKALG